jgi:tetratricopeptide (TPR) repeat protein
MKCTDPSTGQLITRYELGELEPADRERFAAHLLQCDYCYNEVHSMAPFMAVFRERREAVRLGQVASDQTRLPVAIGAIKTPPFWFRSPILAAASLLIMIGAGILALYVAKHSNAPEIAGPPGHASSVPKGTGDGPSSWPDLDIAKAAYIPLGEQSVLRTEKAAAAFDLAMAAYQKSDFTAAAEQLQVVSRLEPEHVEAHFYWGVSLLLLGRSAEAIVPLRQTAQLSDGEFYESSCYYLALAYLKTGRPQRALTELDAVIQLAGHHQAAAAELKDRVVKSLK